MSADHFTTIAWLRRLASEGGKDVVNNIDARSLGRIADVLEQGKAEIDRLVIHMNLLRDAISWFDAHNIDHLPQWVVSARVILTKTAKEGESTVDAGRVEPLTNSVDPCGR